MTSRRRVLDALNHRQPDRVPVDFGGHRSSGIAAIAYARLKKALGITSGDIYVYDLVQQLAIVEEPVLDALGIDVVEMGRGFLTDAAEWTDWELPDGTSCKIPAYLNLERDGEDAWVLDDDGRRLGVQRKGCLYFEQTYWPFESRSFEGDDFTDWGGQTLWGACPTPGAHLPWDEAGLDEMARGAAALRASTERAIIGIFGGSMFEGGQAAYRMDNYLMQIALYPDDALRRSERLCEMNLEGLEKWLGAVGPHIDLIMFGDDLGGQQGPLISPEMYRRLFKPYHARLWGRVKELAPDVKVLLHSCGGIEPLLGDLIEAGLDAVNPVQVSCAGMDAAHLKKTYGRDLCFWGGGCDTRDVLPNATPDAVAAHVRRQVEIMRPDGGFVFQQVHNVMADVPAENLVAMFEAIGA